MNVIDKIKNSIIISVQAMPNEPLYQEECMNAMIKSVLKGGAKALRLAGARDIKNAKKFSDVPIIGLTKPDVIPKNWQKIVYITTGLKEVSELINAGADIIATDGTSRPRGNDNLRKILKCIELHKKLSMADISTLPEAIAARSLGFDMISTTLSGYTQKSLDKNMDEPDFKLLEQAVKILDCPIILEGRIWTPEQVKKAFDLGAHAVVIGSAVTRPQLIVKRFYTKSK
ncbi:MAG: N-acetylmannosamine-6-phosphate 2-epimerase [Candidatus Gastranaerophilales bacterium]|nr:N-acetylmannosamine-6-phosphate 2-epimerase [Candidatus Gastranaerophilales bacterium]